MRVIELDASGWHDFLDLSSALKQALGSCSGHGDGFDAWADSMIWGGMNEIEAPYIVRLTGTARCDETLRAELEEFAQCIARARAWRHENRGDDMDVTIEVRP